MWMGTCTSTMAEGVTFWQEQLSWAFQFWMSSLFQSLIFYQINSSFVWPLTIQLRPCEIAIFPSAMLYEKCLEILSFNAFLSLISYSYTNSHDYLTIPQASVNKEKKRIILLRFWKSGHSSIIAFWKPKPIC